MAVHKIESDAKYIGLSSDTKPDAGTGAKFYEWNTGRKWVYVGADGWMEDLELIFAITEAMKA